MWTCDASLASALRPKASIRRRIGQQISTPSLTATEHLHPSIPREGRQLILSRRLRPTFTRYVLSPYTILSYGVQKEGQSTNIAILLAMLARLQHPVFAHALYGHADVETTS